MPSGGAQAVHYTNCGAVPLRLVDRIATVAPAREALADATDALAAEDPAAQPCPECCCSAATIVPGSECTVKFDQRA